MPLDRLFRKEADQAQNLALDVADAIREEMLEVHNELEVYQTDAWRRVEEILENEAQSAFRDMMSGEPDAMLLARERARVVAKLRSKPQELEQKLAGLRKQLREVEGETDD